MRRAFTAIKIGLLFIAAWAAYLVGAEKTFDALTDKLMEAMPD